MLSNTFMSVCTEATLECRLSFARLVLRLEVYGAMLGMNCKVGKPAPDGTGRYVYEFRVIEGGDNLFVDDVEVNCTELAKTVDANQKAVEEKLEAMEARIISRLADVISPGKPEAVQLPRLPRLGWGLAASKALTLNGGAKSAPAAAPHGATAAHGAAAARDIAVKPTPQASPNKGEVASLATGGVSALGQADSTDSDAPSTPFEAEDAASAALAWGLEEAQKSVRKSTAVKKSACSRLRIAASRRPKASTPSAAEVEMAVGSADGESTSSYSLVRPNYCNSRAAAVAKETVREEPVEEVVAQEVGPPIKYATVRSSSIPVRSSSVRFGPVRSETRESASLRSEWL